jgi:hypothetical protein
MKAGVNPQISGGSAMEKIRTKVRGVTYTNPDGSSRQALIAAHVRAGDPLRIFHRPIGADSNACEVWAAEKPGCRNLWQKGKGVQIGYLSSDLAEQFHRQVKQDQVTAVVLEVTGGGRKSLGVNIELTVV